MVSAGLVAFITNALVCVRECEFASVRVSTHRNFIVGIGACRHAPGRGEIFFPTVSKTINPLRRSARLSFVLRCGTRSSGA